LIVNAVLKSLIIFLYPTQCRYCEENLDPADGHYIHKSCWQKAKFITRPYCETCGYPMSPVVALPDKIASCDKCPENLQFRRARSIASYYSDVGEETRRSAVTEALLLLKSHGKTVMAKPLADLMIKAMPTFFGMEDYDYIVPVPLHKKRRRERGYNQVELIGRRLSSATSIPMRTRSLIKTAHTPPQVGLSYEERQRNVKGHFDLSDPLEHAGKRILLIDDVLTTGATANESAKVLLQKGKAKYVDVFTLLRVLQKP